MMLYEFFSGHVIFVASLGGSAFNLFIFPHAKGSHSRFVIGGYICGSVAGAAFKFLYNFVSGLEFAGTDYVLVLICAAAAAVATFLMVTFKMLHAPAVAMAMGLVKDPDCIRTAAAAIIGVTILCLCRHYLAKYLRDLT